MLAGFHRLGDVLREEKPLSAVTARTNGAATAKAMMITQENRMTPAKIATSMSLFIKAFSRSAGFISVS
jgi:hypothetical protein